MSLIDRYAESAETKLHLGEMLAEDREILAQYLPSSGGSVPAPNNGGHGNDD
jgi:hypothetical protein